MTRLELIKHINAWYREYNIDYYSCYLTHGGALIMQGVIKDTADIDLKVPENIWKLFDNGKFEKTLLSAKGEIPETETIRVTDHIDIQRFDTLHNFADLDFDRGIAYRNLQSTLRDYKLLARPKDLVRIQIIEDYIKTGSQ